MRPFAILSSLCLGLLSSAGCARDQGNLTANSKQGGVAVVDLDRVKEELGRDRVIRTSSTDFREEIKPIAEKVATERGLNTVVTKDNPFILSYGPNADITDAVIARLKDEETSSEESSSEKEDDEESAKPKSGTARKWLKPPTSSGKRSAQMEAPPVNM